MSKIAVISDLHLKESMGYADFVPDRRTGEKAEVLEFIRTSASSCGCEVVVMLGDMLNSRNNPASVLKEYVAFLESFGPKTELFLVAGNHEKNADGSSAIDFLRELSGKDNWHVIVDVPISVRDRKIFFLPYMHKEELGLSSAKEASAKLMERCLAESDKGAILFAHHCISGTSTQWGQVVDMFDEPVLDRVELEKHFGLLIGGHIHSPQQKGNTHVVGSVFANDAGEGERRMLIVDDETMQVTSLPLPGRDIVKVENPTCEEDIPKRSVVRAVVEKNVSEKKMDEIRSWLKGFDGHVLVDMRNRKKKRAKSVEGYEGMSVERLLEMWAKENDADLKAVMSAFSLIKC